MTFSTVKEWVRKDNMPSNMFNLFFLHDLEGVYQRTHAKKHEGVTKYSAQSHAWRTALCSCGA
eukprot:14905363-Ditylum_brightwellii.AAC.1